MSSSPSLALASNFEIGLYFDIRSFELRTHKLGSPTILI